MADYLRLVVVFWLGSSAFALPKLVSDDSELIATTTTLPNAMVKQSTAAGSNKHDASRKPTGFQPPTAALLRYLATFANVEE